jgi:lauroyl/myristoyl acyltransferase
MSLSRTLQSPEIIASLAGRNPSEVKDQLLEIGRRWYTDNPAETAVIQRNLAKFGFSTDAALVENIQTNIILHYFEKIVGLTGTPQAFREFLDTHIDAGGAAEILTAAKNAGKGVLLAICHFGAIEFIGPWVASQLLPVNVLLRFTSAEFSAAARRYAAMLTASGTFGPINFIEIGKPGTMAALDMAAALRRGEPLVTVFDEETDYSVPVTLFGQQLKGGAGLQKIIAFTRANTTLCAAYMIRTAGDRYRLELKQIPPDSANPIQSLYDALGDVVGRNLAQWYFLHEEIPFLSHEGAA